MRIRRDGFWVSRGPGQATRYPWSLVLLPLSLPVVFLLLSTLSIHRTEEFFGWFVVDDPRAQTLGREAFWDAHRAAGRNLFSLRQPPTQSQLPTLDLFVGDLTIQGMLTSLLTGRPELGREPGGDRPYFPAFYVDESGVPQRARVSLRGFGHWHHSPVKPSLRVRIRRDDVELGLRFVELQRPEDVLGLSNWIPEQIGRQIGILTGLSDPVRLFVNRKYFGVYLRNERPGESLAVHQGRLPGMFLKGDALGLKTGVDLWASHAGWQGFGDVDQESLQYFDALLATLRQPPSAARAEALDQYLDREAFAKWAALMLVSGSAHTDDFHNHLYFIDPMTGRLEPVLWDANSFGRHLQPDVPVDHVPNRILGALARDPRWLHQRNVWIHRLAEGPCAPEALEALIDRALERVLPDLRADPNLSELTRTPFPGVSRLRPVPVTDIQDYRARMLDWVRLRHRVLVAYLADARAAAEPTETGSRVAVYGNVAVLARTPKGSLLLYPGRQKGPPLAEKEFLARDTLVPAPLFYELPWAPEELEFSNALTDEPVLADGSLPPESQNLLSFHPDAFQEPAEELVVLGPGTVSLDEDLHCGSRTSLRVEGGTTLLMGPGASIFAEGETRFLGSREQPITIRAAGDQPWGTLALWGPGTAGSRLDWLAVAGGSSDRARGVAFKGMVNVYGSPGVTLSHCSFGANELSDDAVNLAASSIVVEDCSWEGARSDGLDLDSCRGVVSRCRFADCGNDGLDLMTSRIVVTQSAFTRCGDKGISVGEASELIATSNRMEECGIGIQVKDGSRAALSGCTLIGNGIAWDAYRKKSLYRAGGRGLMLECQVEGSVSADFRLDRRSDLLLVRTPGAPSSRVKTAPSVPSEWGEFLANFKP